MDEFPFTPFGGLGIASPVLTGKPPLDPQVLFSAHWHPKDRSHLVDLGFEGRSVLWINYPSDEYEIVSLDWEMKYRMWVAVSDMLLRKLRELRRLERRLENLEDGVDDAIDSLVLPEEIFRLKVEIRVLIDEVNERSEWLQKVPPSSGSTKDPGIEPK